MVILNVKNYPDLNSDLIIVHFLANACHKEDLMTKITVQKSENKQFEPEH